MIPHAKNNDFVCRENPPLLRKRSCQQPDGKVIKIKFVKQRSVKYQKHDFKEFISL